MPRSAKDRLPALVDAAIAVFTREGYRAAHMADIAEQMGVSEAALYRYVDSKDGLFHLVVRHALLLEELPDGPLPLSSPPLEVTIKQLRETISESPAPYGLLSEALRRRAVNDPLGEFEGIVREQFGLQALTRHAMNMIERSAPDVPELADLVSVELRRPFLEALTTYLTGRGRAGLLRVVPHPAATARLVSETITYFARHRFGDPDGAAMTDRVAQDTVVDLLVHALQPTATETGPAGPPESS